MTAGNTIPILSMTGEIEMALSRLIKTAIKIAPIAYPIIRKAMNKRKNSQSKA